MNDGVLPGRLVTVKRIGLPEMTDPASLFSNDLFGNKISVRFLTFLQGNVTHNDRGATLQPRNRRIIFALTRRFIELDSYRRRQSTGLSVQQGLLAIFAHYVTRLVLRIIVCRQLLEEQESTCPDLEVFATKIYHE